MRCGPFRQTAFFDSGTARSISPPQRTEDNLDVAARPREFGEEASPRSSSSALRRRGKIISSGAIRDLQIPLVPLSGRGWHFA